MKTGSIAVGAINIQSDSIVRQANKVHFLTEKYYTKLYQNYTKQCWRTSATFSILQQNSQNYTELHQTIPDFIKLHQTTPTFSKLQQTTLNNTKQHKTTQNNTKQHKIQAMKNCNRTIIWTTMY